MKGPDRQAQVTESMEDLTDVTDSTYEDVPPYLREEPPAAAANRNPRLLNVPTIPSCQG